MDLTQFRKLNNFPAFRKLAHWFFHMYYRDKGVYKILKGPLKDKKWYFRRGTSLWIPLGSYEDETAAWLQKKIQNNSIFLDVGANLGYFSLLASYHISLGKIIAFEPVDKNLEILNKNMKLNNVENVEVISKAVADSEGTGRFAVESNGANSHFEDIVLTHAQMKKEKTVEVEITTLDTFCTRNEIMPDVIKIDVEGAEVKVLNGATKLLKAKKTNWLVSIHSAKLQEDTLRIFEEFGYKTKLMHGLECEIIAIPE